MKPEIEISVDEFKTMTVEVSLMGTHVETITLASASVDALRNYFANEAAE